MRSMVGTPDQGSNGENKEQEIQVEKVKREHGALERIEDMLRRLVSGKSEIRYEQTSKHVDMPPIAREEKAPESANRAARCLDSFLSIQGQFKGKNVTKYLKDYESKTKVNLVDSSLSLFSFITLVNDSLTDIVSELLEGSEGEWSLFCTKMKKEFSAEDVDKLTRSSFIAWVMKRDKPNGPMELLREYEQKLKQLPNKDSRFIEFTKVETFLEAAGPKMRR